MSLWDNMKKVAAKAGNVAMIAGHKTRLHGEILLVDREIKGRKQQFGIDLYNHVGPMANSPDFFAADDPLTETLRPPLLTAQREIAALQIRRTRIKEDIKQAEVKRAASFPDKAITFADKAKNAAKSAALAGNETKLATDLSVVESKVKHFKQVFGEEIYLIFVKLEDEKGWLPTDRTIRAMYDQARQDVEKLEKKRADKIQELESLGGSYTSDNKTGESYDAPAVPVASSVPVPTPPLANPQYQPQGGMFATANTTTPNNNYPPAQTDIFAAPAAPMASTPTMSSFPAPSAPISQTGSYMQSQAPAGGGGYSDTAPMGGGYSDNAPMGGTMGSFSNGSPMGGFSDSGGQMGGGGFSDFPAMSSGGGGSGGGFQPQTVDPTGFADFQKQRMQQKQQAQSNSGFANFPNTQGGSNNYPSSSSSGPPNNDLLW
uniref:Uncharacterized protein n=1 Tax=Amphora coffeiformis TaxID=265554 RepID=A0A7S3L588_9STRA|eukprot:scaffold2519_cov168-Amphora_coffeaeformis.AAC.12